jgi:flagellar basal-body rod modification protein FlgD
MAVSPVAAGSTDAVRGTGQSLAANFDNFLKLLTTQLRNQDPVAPMDANAFTSQLVQFASVEQAIKTNDQLKELGTLISGTGTTSALSMLGRDAVVGTDRVGLGSSGGATIRYRLPDAAARTTASVIDADGRIVRTLTGTTAAGENAIVWDGLDGTGQRAAAGTYRVQIDAVRTDYQAIAAEQYLAGTVEAIEPDAGKISLIVAGAKVPLGDVRSVHTPVPAAA